MTIRPTLIHIHIPKTAGTTLNFVLSVALKEHQEFVCMLPEHAEQLKRRTQAERDQIDFVFGHYPFGLHRLFTRPVCYVACLREPRRRIISLYHFLLAREDHPACEAVKRNSYDFSSFLRLAYEDPTIRDLVDNIQVRMLAGDMGLRNEYKDILSLAMSNITEENFIAGDIGHFDSFIAQLEREVQLKIGQIPKMNVSNDGMSFDGEMQRIDPDARDILELFTRWDMVLCSVVREVGDNSHGEIPPPLQAALVSAKSPEPFSEHLLLRDLMTTLYRVLLLREPDAIGINAYVEELRYGRPIEDVMHRMLRSREFGQNLAQFSQRYLSPGGFVEMSFAESPTENVTLDPHGIAGKPGLISERDVELAYKLMLGRPPENSSVVANLLNNISTPQELRAVLMASQEYREKIHQELGIMIPSHKPLDWPKIDIEVDVSQETLTAMIHHIQRKWASLGESEPHWSVVTRERFKARNIGNNIEEFYASGEHEVSYFTHAADRAGVDYRSLPRCFELGCGVGRLSIWLAQIFPELIAADVSAPHLRLAAEAMERAGLRNVDLRLVNAIDNIEALPAFDCFVSIIVLQHNPPPLIAFLLRTVLGKLNPGGLAYFQVPTYRKGAIFKSGQYLEEATASDDLEIHVIPQATVWRLAHEANCQVLDVREDGWTGIPEVVSNSILLGKCRL